MTSSPDDRSREENSQERPIHRGVELMSAASVSNSARHLSSSLAANLRSSTILLAGASLPRLFLTTLGKASSLAQSLSRCSLCLSDFSKQFH